MRRLALRVSLVLVAAFASLSAGQRSVETIDLAGSRYFISQTSPYVPTLNWFLAYQYCRTIGMELLSIGTAEEAELIDSYLAANRLSNTDYWTSGNQLGSHLWMWMATGQRFNTSFNYWAAEEPFIKAGDSCLSVSNAGWLPQNCKDEKYFVCELTRCFFVNFVSASRGSSQGNSSTTPGSHTTQQQQQQQITPKPEPQKPVSSVEQHKSHQSAASQIPQPTVIADRSFTTITTVEPTTYEEDTFPTTQEPLKTMPTALPEDQFEEQTVISQTSQVKIMPGVKLDLEPAVHNNEIIQSDPINALQLLMPPTREFSPFLSSSSSIPLQAEASTNFTVRRPLSRKETFSWALLDPRSK